MENKKNKAKEDFIYAGERDSIDAGTGRYITKTIGKAKASNQPGRYEKTKERKPNKYKEMYDKKNKK